MTEKKQDELQDLLKEGISALKEMRRGIANACSNLRTVYSTKSLPDNQEVVKGVIENGLARRKNQRSHPIFN